MDGLITSRQCLRQLVPHETWHWIDLYQHYQSRILPYAGGVLDQPAAFMRAMQIIQDQSSD